MKAYDIRNGNEVTRHKSPLEDDVWLMPAHSTEVEPPNFDTSTHHAVFADNKWTIVSNTPPEPEEPVTEELILNAPTQQTKTPEPDYVADYKTKRMDEYGDVYEQLQYITENGLEAWQTRVLEIKSKYPKPE